MAKLKIYDGTKWVTADANNADMLKTARTINGTSFNGTANITTANWGTARTITIGNTAKSVNGSGNVSWSLSEIGAAASSHSHSYLPLAGGTITGDLTMSGSTKLVTSYNYGILGTKKDGTNDYMLYMGSDDNIKLSYGGREVDCQGPMNVINNYGINTRTSSGTHYARVQASTTANEAVFGVANSITGNIVSPFLRIGASNMKFNERDVVASGTGNGGYYVRYYDGTQICWKLATVNLATPTAWNAWYIGSVGLGSMPATFTSTPIISVNPQNPTNTFGTLHITATSASSWGNYWGMRPFSQASAVSITLALIAIGKWK